MIRAIAGGMVVCMVLGCSSGSPPPAPDLLFFDAGSPAVAIAGVAYDPEAFFFSLATWPCVPASDGGEPDCSMSPPPLILSVIPHLVRSSLVDANVSVDVSGELKASTGPTPSTGAWSVSGITGGSGDSVGVKLANGTCRFCGEGGPFPPNVPKIPAAKTYFETRTVLSVPVDGSRTACYFEAAAQLGDVGILEAVARHMSAAGPPVVAADFVNPQKHGGVVVVAMHPPAPPPVRAPAPGMGARGSVGESFFISWAPPGVLPPAANQSTRGYWVTDDVSRSLGISVVVLPAGGAKTKLGLKMEGESFPPQEPFEVTASAGEVTFVPRRLSVPVPPPTEDDPVALPDPDWTCVPK